LHLLQKEQFPGIGSNQPGADLQILDIAFCGFYLKENLGKLRQDMIDFKLILY